MRSGKASFLADLGRVMMMMPLKAQTLIDRPTTIGLYDEFAHID